MENGKQPAFAVSREMCEISEIENYPYGLTKREYFAAAAMQGILSTQEIFNLKYSFEQVLPRLAVMYADELLKQLER
jgi:hypothetical protein